MAHPFPAEILQCIFDYVAASSQLQYDLVPLDLATCLEGLPEQQALVTAARVCRQWRQPAERTLYRQIVLCDPEHASNVLRKLQWYPELANNVETLRFLCLKPLTKSAKINLRLLFRRLPMLRNYGIDITRFPLTFDSEVVPRDSLSPNLKRLELLVHQGTASHPRTPAFQYLPTFRLPRTLEKLELRGISVGDIRSFDLPRLTSLSLDCQAQRYNITSSMAFARCKRLEHLVLNDPGGKSSNVILQQLGPQMKTLELNYDDHSATAVLPIEHGTMKPLSQLETFSFRGNFYGIEVPHIPQSIKYFRWRGASDAEAINVFLEELCKPTYLPNLVEFPAIYMPEEARYRYPSVHKSAIRKATEALTARGLKPNHREEASVWNEKMIFPRIRREGHRG